MAARPGTKQYNFYLEDHVDEEIDRFHQEDKKKDRRYSRSHVVSDAIKVYILAKRYYKLSRTTDSIFDFVHDALQSFVDRKKAI